MTPPLVFGEADPALYVQPPPPCVDCHHSEAKHRAGIGCLDDKLDGFGLTTCVCPAYREPAVDEPLRDTWQP
jgi:hypothetical protein